MEQETSLWSEVVRIMTTPFFKLGETPVTVSGILVAVLVIIASLFVSAIVQRVFDRQVAERMKMNRGMKYAFMRIIHYLILILGISLAAQMIGLSFGSLAVIFGFLSVGIGFGLQNLTSNFISGLILLLERPISPGDFVTIDGQFGRVEHINMRTTIIRTQDNVTIVVPNAKFVENDVTNWSHDGDVKVRLHCPVGVAYGSDVSLVKQTLLDVANANEHVLDDPAAVVVFTEFGDSSLNFELLVWTDRPELRYALHSEINFAIDEAFRKADIQIPFPQRDLHVKMTPAVEMLSGKQGEKS